MKNVTRRQGVRSSYGFTLIEMLVVIAIIALLVALIVPVTSKALDRARRVACQSKVRSMALAVQMLRIDATKDLLPNRGSSHLNYGVAAEALLPYLGDDLRSFDCPSNKGQGRIASQELPSHPGEFTDYEFNSMLGNFATVTDRRFSGVTSPSEAAFVYDRPYWPAPDHVHKGGANVGYMDGHVAWLKHENMGFGNEADMFYRNGHIY